MIPQDFIDDLLARVDIVEVIRSRVELKRAGREWKGCCPFHNEKTPSFTVVPNKQFYHCFGCGAHGHALRFVMDFDRLEFPAAVEVLAAQAGVEVPQQAQDPQAGRNRNILEILDRAHNAFRKALVTDSPAMHYLNQRGVNADMIRRYELGFAPAGWDFLSSTLPDAALAAQAGLLIARDDGRHYDRFRNRVMFPIRDLRGRVVGFGGRTLDDDPAKYLNSPETPVFQKGRLAYGLYEARQSTPSIEQLLITEGYMDVIALAQFGFSTAVATLGTATTPEHLRLFTRQCRRLIFCFDGDAAGRRAADKAVDVCLSVLQDGMDVRFLFLPEADDPDSLIRRDGPEGLQTRIDKAQPLSQRLLTLLEAGLDLNSTEGRASLLEAARKRLAVVEAPAFRSLMLEQLQKRAGAAQATVHSVIGQTRPREVQRRQVQAPTRMTPVRRAIVLLLNFPAIAEQISDIERLAECDIAGTALLAELLDRLHEQPQLHCAALIQAYAGRPEQDILERLSMVDLELDDPTLAAQELLAIRDKLLESTNREARITFAPDSRPSDLDEAARARLRSLSRGRPQDGGDKHD